MLLPVKKNTVCAWGLSDRGMGQATKRKELQAAKEAKEKEETGAATAAAQKEVSADIRV
jgi:hypothetical protein